MKSNETKCMFLWLAFAILAVLFIVSIPFWAGASSTYTNKFGLEMPEQGDIGWDDAIRLNHKIFEVVEGAMIDGHKVKSGVTPTDGGGLILKWQTGVISFKGQNYTIAAGETNLTNNTTNWISGVTMVGSSGATIDVRPTEYYPPSGASGYYTPIAIAKTAAGSIEMLKDVRYIPGGQSTDRSDDVTFNRVYAADQTDSNIVNARSGVSLPSGTTSPTLPTGGAYVERDDRVLNIGVDGIAYALPLEETIQIFIPSPHSLSDFHEVPLFTTSGETLYVTGVTFYCSASGNTVAGIAVSPTQYNWVHGSGTTLWNFVSMDTAGTGVYYKSFSSGVSVIWPDRTITMEYGVLAPAWFKMDLRVRRMGGRH